MPSSVGLSGTSRAGMEWVLMAPMIARGSAGMHLTNSRRNGRGPAAKAAGPLPSVPIGQAGMCRAVQPCAVSTSGLAMILEIVVPP